jgi:uncharacterized protein
MNLTLHLTTACNMSCSYCYAPPQPGPGMSLQVAEQAMDLALRVGDGAPVALAFFGGEPLLQLPVIREIVAVAQARQARGEGRFQFKLTTNGLAMDEPFLDWAEQQHLKVAVSVDGCATAHDAHRRLSGGGPSFHRILPRLEALLARRPYATVYMTVQPDTVASMQESVHFLLDRGVRYLVISLNYAGAWDASSLAVLEAQYRLLAEDYLAWSRAGRKFYLSPFEVKLASHVQGEGYERCRCQLGQRQVSVDPEGWIYPCVQFTTGGAAWRIGHVATGFDEAARARLYALSQRLQAPCADCGIRGRCGYTCGCLNWQATGSLTQVSPVLCRHERMLVPLADGIGAELYAEGNRAFMLKHYEPAGPLLSLLEDAVG